MQTRRERRRDAAYDDIVRAARDLLAEGSELSLRAVATRLGLTAPAMYRYVTSYQDLVDLVAFEIDKATAALLAAAADTLPAGDVTGRLALSAAELRVWALAHPREFGLVFANPVAASASELDSGAARREVVTQSSSNRFFADQVLAIWRAQPFPVPALDDLPPAVREAVLDPLIPVDVHDVAPEDRGLVWVYMQGWNQLYGVISLEVFGHVDPRVIESGDMFVDVLRSFAPRVVPADDVERLIGLVRARLGAG